MAANFQQRQRVGEGPLLTLALLTVGGYFLVTKVIKPGIITPLQLKKEVTTMRVTLPPGSVKIKADQVLFDLHIENPNPQPLIVAAIVGNTLVTTKEGQTYNIGRVARYGTTVIKPTAETIFHIAVVTKTINLVALLSQIFAGKVSGLTLTFAGSVNVNGRVWPIKERVQIS